MVKYINDLTVVSSSELGDCYIPLDTGSADKTIQCKNLIPVKKDSTSIIPSTPGDVFKAGIIIPIGLGIVGEGTSIPVDKPIAVSEIQEASSGVGVVVDGMKVLDGVPYSYNTSSLIGYLWDKMPMAAQASNAVLLQTGLNLVGGVCSNYANTSTGNTDDLLVRLTLINSGNVTDGAGTITCTATFHNHGEATSLNSVVANSVTLSSTSSGAITRTYFRIPDNSSKLKNGTVVAFNIIGTSFGAEDPIYILCVEAFYKSKSPLVVSATTPYPSAATDLI